MRSFAFSETDEAAEEITRLFDFVWPTAVALWNLRWQVDGFLKAVPDASYHDVASRFVVGSGINGADIRSMSRNTSWDEQKSRFAEFVLTNVFAVYEGWAKRIVKKSGLANFSERNLYRIGNGTTDGLSAFITRVNATPSAIMQTAFEQSFLSHKKVYIAEQNAMLTCYRYFKQIRNVQIHNSGFADQEAVNAYNQFVPVSDAASLRIKEAIEHFPVALGSKAQLSLRGVVGFCDVVFRLMITIDAQISGSMAAERAFVEKIISSQKGHVPTLNSGNDRAKQQIKSMCRKARMPPTQSESELLDYFISKRLASR